jgi:hypothetical protein
MKSKKKNNNDIIKYDYKVRASRLGENSFCISFNIILRDYMRSARLL